MPDAPQLPSLETALGNTFGFGGFRPGQRELIEAVLGGRDALGVLPTGGGKSLVYQLPATLLRGLTVVVSPLIALMKDQVDAFNRRGRHLAVALHSNLPAGEARHAFGLAAGGRASLLYVAPERFEFPGFKERLLSLRPALFVIDEAHCVNQWGYDFRPSYLSLGDMIPAIRPAPVLALTATATPETRSEILARLGMRDPRVFVASFDRPNLRLEVHPCQPAEKDRRLRRLLREETRPGSHIVYVGRRADAERIASGLNQAGFRAVAYHAGMNPEARRMAQEIWLSGKSPIAVATVAFGMGIDKPDVRSVIHYQHPASLEAYYQEAGRAGRDLESARCIVLYSARDVALAHFFLRNRYPSPQQVSSVLGWIAREGTTADGLRLAAAEMSDEQVNVALWVLGCQRRVRRDADGLIHRCDDARARTRPSLDPLYERKRADYRRLDEVIAYCREESCHRGRLLRYFGEPLGGNHRCGNCSACLGGTARIAVAANEDEAVRIFWTHREELEAESPVTPRLLARFLHGSSAKSLPGAWRRIPGFGALRSLSQAELEELSARIIESDPSRLHLAGQLRLRRSPPPVPPAAPEPPPDPAPEEPPFWKTASRSYRSSELAARQVPRARGMAILRMLDQAARPLSASGLANAVRGARGSDVARDHPEFEQLPSFGALRGTAYDAVLEDVLAMWAKGYLRESEQASRLLELTDQGRAALRACQ